MLSIFVIGRVAKEASPKPDAKQPASTPMLTGYCTFTWYLSPKYPFHLWLEPQTPH